MTSKRDAADIMREQGPGALRTRYDKDYAKEKQPNGKTYYCIEDVHTLFKKWFGKEYDTATLDAVLAAPPLKKCPAIPLGC